MRFGTKKVPKVFGEPTFLSKEEDDKSDPPNAFSTFYLNMLNSPP